MTRVPRIAIVGGGIGGLAAALALERRGFETVVCEQSPALSEIGAGVNLTPNALKALRDIRRKGPTGEWISVSGADPLNLVGILTPGPKLAALTGNRVLYRDGIPVALFAAGEAQFLATLDPQTEWEARKLLLRAGAGQSRGAQTVLSPSLAPAPDDGRSDSPLQ